jgi:regulator of replication initiation timing
MPEENKKSGLNPIIIMSLIIFVVGVGLGFYIYSYINKPEKKDFKAMLKEVIAYIDSMETLNKNLSAEVEGLKKDNSMLKSPSNAQLVALQSRIQGLERENASLRSMAGQTQYLIQENARLNSEIQILRSRLGSMPVPQMNQGAPPQGMQTVPPLQSTSPPKQGQ